MFVELGDCVVIGSGTNIKHEGVLWLDIFADSLEEPLVTVNLTIISLLESKDEVDSSVLEIFKNGTFINGPSVKKFQSDLESYLNVKHVIPCANGTDALQIALMSLGLLHWRMELHV